MRINKLRDTSTLTDDEIQIAWEEAYQRFETQEEEIQKFTGDLTMPDKRIGEGMRKLSNSFADDAMIFGLWKDLVL